MVLRAFLPIVLTVLFLVGRWSLQRLAVNPDTVDFDLVVERSVVTVLIEPRFWLVMVGVLLLVLMGMGTSRDAPAHSGRLQARASVRLFLVCGLYLIASGAWSPSDNPFPAVVDICLMLVTVLVVERAARYEEFVESVLALVGTSAHRHRGVRTVHSALPGARCLSGSARSAFGPGGRPEHLGRFLGMLCLLMVARSFRYGGGLRWSVTWRIVAAAALILLLQTGSRGALTGFLIGLLVLLIVRRMNVRLIGIGVIVILSFEYLFSAVLNADIVEYINERWLVTTLEQGYLSARDVLLEEAYRLWLERPVFGSGLDSFEYYTFGLDRYPHNLVMQVAQDGGIVAALLLLAWIVHVILSFRHGRNHYTEIGLSMTALIFGCALFSGDFYDSRLMFIFGVPTVSSADIEASRQSAVADEERNPGLIGMVPSEPGGR